MMASAPDFRPTISSNLRPSARRASRIGCGRRSLVLRIEGFAAFAAALALYAHGGFSWPVFALLFLAPDLTMLAYFAGPRVGATRL